VCSAKKDSSDLLNAFFFMPQFSQVGIRDADHQGSISLQLGNLSGCNAVVLEAPPSVNSGPVFLVQDWSVDGRDCNAPPNI